MRTSTAVIVGAIAGGLALIVASVGVHAVNWVKRAAPALSAQTRITESPTPPLPVYDGVYDVCLALAEEGVGCMNLHHVPLMTDEIEAANVLVSGNGNSRISIYRSRAAVDRLVSTATGYNAWRQPVDLIAGENWTLTVLLVNGVDHSVAYRVQRVIGGTVHEAPED